VRGEARKRGIVAVDHRFALSKPALVSALSKKTFSNVNSPILAWSAFTSTGGGAASYAAPNTPTALSSSCARHWVI